MAVPIRLVSRPGMFRLSGKRRYGFCMRGVMCEWEAIGPAEGRGAHHAIVRQGGIPSINYFLISNRSMALPIAVPTFMYVRQL